MNVGDLVEVMGARDLINRIGLVVRILAGGPFGMQVFEIMREDGTLETYTSAAIRRIL